MNKEKIFVNKIVGNLGNNQSFYEVGESRVDVSNEEDIEDKLNKLFNTNGYIFNIKVKIITNEKTYNTKIASRIKNSLITLDNDIINIDSIKDIIF